MRDGPVAKTLRQEHTEQTRLALIGAATLIAWLVFDHLPDPWAWLGMAIIAVCGAATAWLNVRSAQRAHRVIPAASADTVAD